MKQQINMVGGGFQHEICSSAHNTPTHIEWVKHVHSAPISVHIDYAIQQPVDKAKLNFAWISESSTINIPLIDWVKVNIMYLENTFELIFTHDTRLLPLSDKMRYVICNARPWIKEMEIYKKTKLVSMIASKKLMCKEHYDRQKVVEKYRGKIDLFGRGYSEIENKLQGLKDYAFSITMENSTYPVGVTEKIADCFATGTVPIYYGCKEVNNEFNPDGIIWLDEDFKVEDLSFELYFSKMNAIQDNFTLIQNRLTAEDYMYLTHIKNYDKTCKL